MIGSFGRAAAIGAVSLLAACSSGSVNPWAGAPSAPSSPATDVAAPAPQSQPESPAPATTAQAPVAAPSEMAPSHSAPSAGVATAGSIVSVLAKTSEASRQVYSPGDGPKVSFGESLLTFDTGSATIRPASYAQLDQIAEALQHPDLQAGTFLVVGHTDKAGSREYNLDLSKRRADAVLAYLNKKYILSVKIKAEGRAFDELADPSDPYASVNRRVTLVRID